MEIEESFLYTKEHEWISIEENTATMGITDYAQEALGDVTYVELPEMESEVEQFEQFVSVESVKAASDIFSPISGRIIEVNHKLEDDPSLINKDCYGKGWIAKIDVRDMDESTNLMNAEEYRSYIDTLGH
ncbi:MAG: glycine cleavage system protein GcvH [Candidatus Omnitrophica bacterium]|nr:glycine cleavage system protein GcvH [Candidatus Omnitrophota bacterium]MDE2010099.1 glycine cleavage system protein GcvH [Candidatus Omnitrophota bacterium]MDE2214925.1 glycine cleavage system protein GcvH [Candidatus Omnitrophota bacterium]MDE2232270.1 glycine cleavage system protein GcvH [Candidatus Omnitrophota bacterium]